MALVECSRCRRLKDSDTDFYKGVHYCKTCKTDDVRRYQDRNVEKLKAYRAEYYQRRKAEKNLNYIFFAPYKTANP